MKKLWKVLLCGLFALGFTVIVGAYSLKAEDNTLIADLDGDGDDEIITYEENVVYNVEDDSEYSFRISIDGKEAWSEGRVIEAYPDEPEENYIHDVLHTLGYITVNTVDVNPSNKYTEIVATYYSEYNMIVLGVKVFRLKNGKLTVVGEDYKHVSSFGYVLSSQKKNKYLAYAEDIWTPTFGTLWIKIEYKMSKKGFTERNVKSGVYNVAPQFANDGSSAKFKAARNMKVFADSDLTEFKGEITKGQKFTIKKVKLTDKNTYEPFLAYVKTSSGLKGWIYVYNETDEYGDPLEDLVTERVMFS